MPSSGLARAMINSMRVTRRKTKGRCFSLDRSEEPEAATEFTKGNKILPVCSPKEEPEKYRYMMRGNSKNSRSAQGVAKVMVLKGSKWSRVQGV